MRFDFLLLVQEKPLSYGFALVSPIGFNSGEQGGSYITLCDWGIIHNKVASLQSFIKIHHMNFTKWVVVVPFGAGLNFAKLAEEQSVDA
jgi:hypothetical protein